MGSCAAPSAKGDDKFITTDYLQQCLLLQWRISMSIYLSFASYSGGIHILPQNVPACCDADT
ncbi:hypothetical protein, partial [Salmonella enterica]|uniref:hypothetical protein n=1 Tax=Salmonella enterica TaxID=28901 RepID=UPI00398C6D69